MSEGIEVIGIYVRDQDEALAFYVDRLGFRVQADVRNGDYRWLTVQHPEQPVLQLGLFRPGPPVHDAATADALHGLVAKDCRAAFEALSAKGVEFVQEPISRYGQVDAGFRDPSGNGWKMIERQRKETA